MIWYANGCPMLAVAVVALVITGALALDPPLKINPVGATPGVVVVKTHPMFADAPGASAPFQERFTIV
jgi:hypothetical protein